MLYRIVLLYEIQEAYGKSSSEWMETSEIPFFSCNSVWFSATDQCCECAGMNGR